MSTIVTSLTPRWQIAGLWVIKVLLVLAFAAAGSAKLYGVPMLVENFERIGIGQWFRYLTGSLELIGAIVLLVPGKAVFGALLLVCIMIGAIASHVFVTGGSGIPALVLLILAAVVAFAHRGQLPLS